MLATDIFRSESWIEQTTHSNGELMMHFEADIEFRHAISTPPWPSILSFLVVVYPWMCKYRSSLNHVSERAIISGSKYFIMSIKSSILSFALRQFHCNIFRFVLDIFR